MSAEKSFRSSIKADGRGVTGVESTQLFGHERGPSDVHGGAFGVVASDGFLSLNVQTIHLGFIAGHLGLRLCQRDKDGSQAKTEGGEAMGMRISAKTTHWRQLI